MCDPDINYCASCLRTSNKVEMKHDKLSGYYYCATGDCWRSYSDSDDEYSFPVNGKSFAPDEFEQDTPDVGIAIPVDG